MHESDTVLGVLNSLCVFLSLTENGAQLQLELALHEHLLHAL